MIICIRCFKKPHRIAFSRHQKGSSGASEWPLRAQITKHTQKPNLHLFKSKSYCTKCLRIIKKDFRIAMNKAPASPVNKSAASVSITQV